MRDQRAPRSKKRISCEITVSGVRYAGIVLDLSATGLWIQTNAKISQKDLVASDAQLQVRLSLPGAAESVTVDARVVRMKVVPPQFVGVQHGGIGLEVANPSEAYLALVASISPEQAAAVEAFRKTDGGASARAPAKSASTAPKRFRVHAVETSSGRKSTYIATAKSEDEASAEVIAQLGEEFQVLFVERV